MKYKCWNINCERYAGYGLIVQAQRDARYCPFCGKDDLREHDPVPRWWMFFVGFPIGATFGFAIGGWPGLWIGGALSGVLFTYPSGIE